MSVALTIGVLVPAWSWMSSQEAPGYAEGPGNYVIRMTDYAFSPSRMVWRVGDHVSVTLINDSQGHPGRLHEFMVGRQPNREQTLLGVTYPGGFVLDLLSGVRVSLSRTQEAEMVMPGEAELTGPDADEPFVMSEMGMPGMDMDMPGMEDHGGFMVELQASGVSTISFVVPDRPGVWEFGCFSQTGEHYANGMKGLVTIIR